ncbi:MAG: transcriptional repressor [Gillisia sp.]|nr:transcriptional repressor [Gillisia sp.]
MKKIEDFLIQKQVKPTAMRLLVYKFLKMQLVATSLTHIELAFDKAERTTIYRTLKTFEKNGLVHKIDDGSGIAKFALCEDQCNCDLETDLHLHFHCTNCSETICLTEQKIPQINLPPGFKAIDANLVVKGICNKCNLV